ncbi:hypothetical protein TNIN_157401, partial [Trichonephila inaurata madagascariensis]
PVLLNCSHSFCRRCIRKWKVRQNLCPICREYITTLTENDTLEGFISSIAELLGEDFMQERQEALNDRQAAEESDNEDPYVEMFMDMVNNWARFMNNFLDNDPDTDIITEGLPAPPSSIDSDA